MASRLTSSRSEKCLSPLDVTEFDVEPGRCEVAFKPNYRQERVERDRRARLRKAEKQEARDKKTLERKALPEPKPEASPEEDGGES